MVEGAEGRRGRGRESWGVLAKCASARSKSFAISSTGFKGDGSVGANAVFSASIRSLNAGIEPSWLNVSWRVSRGLPALGFFAASGADIQLAATLAEVSVVHSVASAATSVVCLL